MTVKKVLDIARRELGTKESPANSNRVKYNTWYYGREVSGSAYPWCMAFVQWVFAQAGVPLPLRTASCGALMNAAKKEGRWVTKDYRPGDVVIYDFPGGAATDHTGIIERVTLTGVVAIEGNTSEAGSQSNGGMVCRKTRPYSLIVGAVRPKFEEDKYGAPAGTQQSGPSGERTSSGINELSPTAGAKDMEAARTMDNTPSPAHKEGVEWAKKNGILTGDTAGDLKLTEDVTRQQLCTMLYRFAKSTSMAEPP